MWLKTDMWWSTLLNIGVDNDTQILRQRYIIDMFVVWVVLWGLFWFVFLFACGFFVWVGLGFLFVFGLCVCVIFFPFVALNKKLKSDYYK